MNVRDVCQPVAITATLDESVIDAARRMREKHTGSLVVVASHANARGRPVGILTDRDIAIGVVAQAPEKILSVSVGDIMTPEPLTVRADEDFEHAIRRMARLGVRRAPVVDGDGVLAGILAVDDALESLSNDLSTLVELFWQERRQEQVHKR